MKNTTHVRRYLQEVEVILRTDKIVKFVNEFGSTCIMTVKQFDEIYKEK